VGMRPTDSGTTQSLRPHRVPGSLVSDDPVGDPGASPPLPAPTVAPTDPGPAPAPSAIEPVPAPGPDPEEPAGDARTESRSALRAARRRRRRISIVCAVLIAVCTALTLLIVAVARDRTPGPQVVIPAASFAVSPPVDHHAIPAIPSPEILGAPAPQGGHR